VTAAAPRDGLPHPPGQAPPPEQPPGQPGPGWRGAAPEIVIAGLLTVASTAAGYALAGPAGATLVVSCATAAGLVMLRAFLPPADPAAREDYLAATGRPPLRFTGYWRRRSGLLGSTRSAAAFDAELRGTLQTLLAARLAERHGVILYSDPAAARRLLCRAAADDALWPWVDPDRPQIASGDQPGIPPRTLARLIDRLEQL